ncbi:MAG: alpha/beta hydrolase [Alphaproteobacteria bacterium]
MPVHPQARALLDRLAAAPLPLRALPPAEARAAYDRFIEPLNFDPAEIGRVEDVEVPGPRGAIRLRLYHPGSGHAGALPMLYFIHGGGFVIGSIESRDPQCRLLSRDVPCIVASVDYRMAPEHPFPAAPEDCWAGLRWLADNAARLGGDPARIAVGGESAGGNLAAVMAQQARREGGPRLAYQMLIYPWTDVFFVQGEPSYALLDEEYFLTRAQVEWYRAQYVPAGTDRADRRLSPALEPDLAGLPPAQIITAEFDPLRDDGRRYADRLAAAGVPVDYACMEGMVHGYWHYGKLIDASGAALARSIAALKAAFGR